MGGESHSLEEYAMELADILDYDRCDVQEKGTLSGRAEANEFDCEEDIAKPNR